MDKQDVKMLHENSMAFVGVAARYSSYNQGKIQTWWTNSSRNFKNESALWKFERYLTGTTRDLQHNLNREVKYKWK